jgi:hypothetical protein
MCTLDISSPGTVERHCSAANALRELAELHGDNRKPVAGIVGRLGSDCRCEGSVLSVRDDDGAGGDGGVHTARTMQLDPGLVKSDRKLSELC